MSITPKNWDAFQHYTDRKPSWIKLHRSLLDDYKFSCLPVASRALAPCLWLLASEYEGGKITADFDEIAFRLRMTKNEMCEALNPLIEEGFFVCDSAPLADRKRDASLEKERETQVQTEKEKNNWPSDFREVFWLLYPRKVGKSGALSELERTRKRGVAWEKLIDAVRAYAATADPQFTKHPKTWLTNGCWDDEPDTRSPNGKSENGIIAAQRQHIANRIEFGPKPSLIPGATGDGAVRMLPEGGRERPGDLHGGDHGDPGGIPGRSDPTRHGPEDGDRADIELVADRGGS